MLSGFFLEKVKIADEDLLESVSPIRVNSVFIFNSWALIAAGVNFGYFLGFYLEISETCNNTTELKTQ